MRKTWVLGGSLISVGMLLLFIWRSSQPSVTSFAVVHSDLPSPPETIRYEQRTLGQSLVHTLLIPASSQFLVTPALSKKVSTVEDFSRETRSDAILNGGFFDPVNQKSTSYVVLQGKLVADPRENERLTSNPKLKSYLVKIFNRTEFRRYLCGQTIRYDIAPHNEPLPTGCQLVDALGGGPSLLPELTLAQEGVEAVNKFL